MIESSSDSKEKDRLRQSVEQFTKRLIENFQHSFHILFEKYQQTHPLPLDKILLFLKERELDRPKFDFYPPPHAKQAAKLLGFDVDLHSQEGVLKLCLPKPIAQYWWKGKSSAWIDDQNRSIDINHSALEWGFFYRELVPPLWKEQRREHAEGELDILRINPHGVHDPKHFYNLYRVALKKRL